MPIHSLGTAASQQKENRLKYQSNEYIEDNDLRWMNFNARQYDPQIGRFLSIDPLAYQYGQQIYSPYAAMGNNPGMMVDPNGTNPGYASIDYRSDELIGPSAHEMWLQETGNNVSLNIKSTNSNYSINAVDVNSYHYSEAEREYAMAAIQSAILAGISVTEAINFDFGAEQNFQQDLLHVLTGKSCGVVVDYMGVSDEDKSFHAMARQMRAAVGANTVIVLGHANTKYIYDFSAGIESRKVGATGLDYDLNKISSEYRAIIARKKPATLISMGCNSYQIAKEMSKKYKFLTVIGAEGTVEPGLTPDKKRVIIERIDKKSGSKLNDGRWIFYKNG